MNFEKFGVKIGGELCPHNYKIIKVKKAHIGLGWNISLASRVKCQVFL